MVIVHYEFLCIWGRNPEIGNSLFSFVTSARPTPKGKTRLKKGRVTLKVLPLGHLRVTSKKKPDSLIGKSHIRKIFFL